MLKDLMTLRSDQYQLDLGEGGFEIINFGVTFPKNMSSIDHGFCNKPEAIKKYATVPIDQSYSDHSMIYVEVEGSTNQEKEPRAET